MDVQNARNWGNELQLSKILHHKPTVDTQPQLWHTLQKQRGKSKHVLSSCMIGPFATWRHMKTHKTLHRYEHRGRYRSSDSKTNLTNQLNTSYWFVIPTTNAFQCVCTHMQAHTHTDMCKDQWCENLDHAGLFTQHSDPQTEDYTRDNPCVCLCLSFCLPVYLSIQPAFSMFIYTWF